MVGNLRKIVLNVVISITCPLVDMNFIFSWSTRYLTRSLRSLVRYRVAHLKIKFISTRRHVISSMYYANEESDDVIGGSPKTAQHSIENDSRNIQAVFFKLCIIQKRKYLSNKNLKNIFQKGKRHSSLL